MLSPVLAFSLEFTPAVQVASVLALGIVAQWVAWRLRLPAIVLLLVFGVALGRVLPAKELGADQDLFFALVSLAVGVILFEGGLSLNFREIHGTKGVVARLVSVGLVITWLATAAAAHYVGDFSVPTSLLLGALLTVSGPTVVLPLLRHVQPVRRIGSLAKWEGIVNDPIGAVLAALVFEVVLGQAERGEFSTGDMFVNLGLTIVWGLGLAALGAWFLLSVLRQYLVPDFLQNPLILSFVMLLFAASNQLQHESGLVTVTLMGVILANQRKVELRHVVEFKENLRVLLISMLFIVLASRLEFTREKIAELGWGSLGLVLLIIVVIRPIAVFCSTLGSSLSWNERAFLAWIHPRGIVAAAVSSLLALRITLSLKESHPDATLLAEAERFELVTFLVIMASVTIYGLTLAPLARWLGLSGENPQGVIFAGASRAAREIALAIKEEGFPVMLVDTNHKNNSSARMKGLSVTRASIGSEFVQEEIDLGGIGRLLAMTPNNEVNTLAVQGFTERFGRVEVYQLASPEAGSEKTESVTAYRRGRILFDRPTTFAELEERFEAGATIKKTMLTEDFSYADFLAEHGENVLPLFRVEGKRLIVETDENEANPKSGQKVIALIDKSESVLDRENKTTTLSDDASESSIGAGL